jgi:hypothetical protein
MTARELIEMVDALEIPPKLITNSRYTFTGLEAFCLLSACFHSAGDRRFKIFFHEHLACHIVSKSILI